ncbi:sensor histidine kinase [Zhouia sp. PK063]|uniref:sensor histidine kinase n=1 Tax=Zhouia sp. PK063 TaxID=3373602 RepID=UPI0037BD1095
MLKSRRLFIAIFVISVIGLAYIQYQYLHIGIQLAKVQFNQKMGGTTRQIQQDLANNNELTYLLSKALKKDNSDFKLSVDSLRDAASHYTLDYVRDRLLANGIKTNFSYLVYSRDSTYELLPPKKIDNPSSELNYPILLSGYLEQELGEPIYLSIQFEDVGAYFVSQLNGLTIPSIVFIIAIIIAVIWVLKSLYWQRSVITTTNDFINNLTHELKTPVFSIGLASKMLEESKNSEKDLQMIKIIRDQNDKLKSHVDKVLELSQLENNKQVLVLEEIDFKPVLDRLAEEYTALASLEAFTFTSTIANEKFLIKAPESHLKNAISNLLDNAKKYSENTPVISLSAYVKHHKLIIEIADKGIGLSTSDKQKIFEKFYRVSTGNLHNAKGYGLGLNYVWQVVTFTKGRISVQSELGSGTKMIVEIPLIKRK